MIRATLLTDGSSDRVLLPIVRWVLRNATSAPVDVQWADLGVVAQTSIRRLDDKVRAALENYPCDILFVHRDAEAQDPEMRYREIARAVPATHAYVPVVPVRMQEAWLLHDEAAIRRASGRPTGRTRLELPNLGDVERVANPKDLLHGAIVKASEASGRRARRLHPTKAVHLLAEHIDDWSPLRRLSAFQRFEQATREVVERLTADA